jgi:hypothetical protein
MNAHSPVVEYMGPGEVAVDTAFSEQMSKRMTVPRHISAVGGAQDEVSKAVRVA